MKDLSTKALLVSLSISQWAARKLDKKETAALIAKHGVDSGAATVNKRLLSSATLDAIHKKSGQIRHEFDRRSLPWGRGVSIIKAESYLDFTNFLRPQLAEWRKLVDDFLLEYPRLRDDARHILNGLYRDDDYPDPFYVRRKFDIDVAFTPVPAPEDCARVEIIGGLADDLARELVEKQQRTLQDALGDAWKRIYEVVKRAHDTLSVPDAIFRDSLVDNAAELCAILPSLNITNDPKLEDTRRELERSLATTSPDMLRQSPTIRQDTADKMADIMKKMGAMYGAAA